MIDNEIKNHPLFNEFSWVCRVIDSCKTEEQVINASKLNSLYVQKYMKDIESISILNTLKSFLDGYAYHKLETIKYGDEKSA